MQYYLEELLPLAGKMRALAAQMKEKGKSSEADVFATLESQVGTHYAHNNIL